VQLQGGVPQSLCAQGFDAGNLAPSVRNRIVR